MNYAIIKNEANQLLEVFELGSLDSGEWDNYSVVKDSKDDLIKWFSTEADAVRFLVKNFPEVIINKKYRRNYSYDGQVYYV